MAITNSPRKMDDISMHITIKKVWTYPSSSLSSMKSSDLHNIRATTAGAIKKPMIWSITPNIAISLIF